MATLEQLEAALRAADAAGNTEDAKRLAQAYAAARQAPQKSMAERYQAAGIDPTSDPTEGNSALQNALIGYGKSGVDSARGIGQALGLVSADDVDAARKRDAPLMATTGGTLGNIAGQVHQMAAAPEVRGLAMLGKAAPLARSVLQGGLFSAAQGVGTGESRMANTAEGAALGAVGHGLQAGVARVGKGMSDKIAPEVMDLYQKAQAAGIPIHFSQLSDSKAVKTLASMLGYLPFTGAGAAAKTQQEAFVRAASRGFGADSGNLSDGVMKDAAERLSNEYSSIYKGKHIAVTEFPIRKMLDVVRDASENLTEADAKIVSNQFDKIVRKAEDGSLTGEQYQALRTSLGDAANNGNVGRYVKMLRKTLDETAKIGLGPQDAARLTKVQGQWANLKTVQKALQQAEGASGNIKPGNLWNLVKNGSTKEMRELAKIGKKLLTDPIPDSGTAGRLLATGGLGVAGATTGLAAVTPLAKLLLLGATVGRAANSKAATKYVTQGNKPVSALARLLRPAPLLLPSAARAEQQP